jgi:hypothetical protein
LFTVYASQAHWFTVYASQDYSYTPSQPLAFTVYASQAAQCQVALPSLFVPQLYLPITNYQLPNGLIIENNKLGRNGLA